MSAQTNDDFSLTINRHIPADRNAVFDAWTRAEVLTRWFSPSADFRVVVLELDVRVGGKFRIEMHEADGIHTVYGEYVEISRPDRLIFTWAWEHSDDGAQMLVTVELTENPDGTALTLLHEKLPSETSRDLHKEGWDGCLSRLDTVFE